ncbi:MAG: type VI secretion system tube protein Hcp [Coxiellaceae bacterium]|nr:MAG: type VI secretion system tube protein Hcp [Coxiellaceae bacterium]
MASPAYLTIVDEQGNSVKADVKIKGREGTAEVHAFDYHVAIPSDPNTGALTAVRKHGNAVIIKTYDSASPILFDACCRGKTLQSMRIDWYRINDKGEEELYYTHTLTGVKVVKVRQFMQNVKDPNYDMLGHQEELQLRFQQIQMTHPDGNIMATDNWNESRTGSSL